MTHVIKNERNKTSKSSMKKPIIMTLQNTLHIFVTKHTLLQLTFQLNNPLLENINSNRRIIYENTYMDKIYKITYQNVEL